MARFLFKKKKKRKKETVRLRGTFEAHDKWRRFSQRWIQNLRCDRVSFARFLYIKLIDVFLA